MKRPPWLPAVFVATLVLGGTAILVFVPVRQYLGEWLVWLEAPREALGIWGPIGLVVVYVLGTVLLVPGSLMTMGAGLLFGVVLGTITISIASTTAATVAFLLGRWAARPWVERRVARSRRFHALDQAVGRQGFRIVLLTRLSPVFPFTLLNYAYGLTNVRLRHYVLASWIGMLPGTVMYVYLGSAVRSAAALAAGRVEAGPWQKILFGVGLLTAVVVTVLVTRLARKALRGEVPLPEQDSAAPEQQDTVHSCTPQT